MRRPPELWAALCCFAIVLLVVALLSLAGCSAEIANVHSSSTQLSVRVPWWLWVPLVAWWWLRLIGRASR